MKKCYMCETKKPDSAFHQDGSRKDGLSNRCRVCQKTYTAGHYQRNAAKVAARRRAERHALKVAELVNAGVGGAKAKAVVTKIAEGKALRDAARTARDARIAATKAKLNLADMLK